MARQPRTPGATIEAPKPEVVQTPAPTQDDATLDAILGAPDAESTSAPSEPVQEEPATKEQQDKQEYEEFLEWRNNKASAAPVAPHVPTSSVVSEPVAKRTRQVCGPHGWTTEEY
ncbi:hypothetical protein [Acinetobacter sp. ANC 5378]|uniref:hypothetical protein n=1 Tax=Acinetobacter sp. ANC 5378 TaxID=2731249 RepID=UPI00148FD6B9|nr:hypothetical protein [Acinetobacter sp. ANC 5378]NNG82030.1 hypothetical protein [Acinetobacter sp. ANC 5378]